MTKRRQDKLAKIIKHRGSLNSVNQDKISITCSVMESIEKNEEALVCL